MKMHTFALRLSRSLIPRHAALKMAALVTLAWSGPAFCGEIHDATRRGDLAEVKALLKESPDLAFGQEDDQTPLLLAAAFGHKDVAGLLLAYHADVNPRDSNGKTPLYWAADRGYADVVKLLLDHKADVEASDLFGDTPLHRAAMGGFKDVAELLLAGKAEMNSKNHSGRTPLDYATSGNHKEVAGVLLAKGAEPLPSQGADYHSAKGFRVHYPDGWQIVTAATKASIQAAAGRFVQNIDFDRMDVMIYNPNSDPLQNVNIIVTPGAEPISKEGLSELESGVRKNFSSAGITVENLELKIVHVGNYDAILSTWMASFPGLRSEKMRQQQYIISGKVRGYIITCSAGAANSAETEPVFASIVGSFQIGEEADRTPEEFWSALPPAVRNALIGAGIGAGIGLAISALGALSKKVERM